MNSNTSTPPPAVRGRFAPSPTGPLHFGSMVAAVGCFLNARAAGGEWLVRIEDLDAPRVVPGASDDILRTLERFGLRWDGEVVYQSGRVEIYEAHLEGLRRQGVVYPCGCSRREIAEAGSGVYPGTCRGGLRPGQQARAWRVNTAGQRVQFTDRLQGTVRQHLERDVGDFVVHRADGFFAYQFAVVVDDALQGVTEVVRGADLLDSAPRQIYLQRLLGFATPSYLHLPVAINAEGEKLSKQTLAPPVAGDPVPLLCDVLAFLGHAPPAELRRASLATLWQWALEAWSVDRVPAVMAIPVGEK